MKPENFEPWARSLLERVAELDEEYALDLQFGGDGDNGEILVDLLSKALHQQTEKLSGFLERVCLEKAQTTQKREA